MKYPNTWLRWNSKKPPTSLLFLVTFFLNTNGAFWGAAETTNNYENNSDFKISSVSLPLQSFSDFYQRKYIFKFLLLLSPWQLFKILCSKDYWGSWKETENSSRCVLKNTLNVMTGAWLWTWKGRQWLALSQTVSDKKSRV